MRAFLSNNNNAADVSTRALYVGDHVPRGPSAYPAYIENEELLDGRQLAAQFAFDPARAVPLLLFLLQAAGKLQVGIKGRRRGRGSRRLGGRSGVAAAAVSTAAFLFFLQPPCQFQVSLAL